MNPERRYANQTPSRPRSSGQPDRGMRRSTRALMLAGILLMAGLVPGCANVDGPEGDTGSDPADDGADAGDSGSDDDGDTNQSGGQGARTDGQDERRDEVPWTGAWLGVWPGDENRAIANFNEETESRLDVVNVLVSWNTSFSSVRPALTDIASAGARPMITWSPTNLTTEQIADGSTQIHLDNNETTSLDAYVASWAEGLCQFSAHTGQSPLLEPMPEPNGNWHAWSIGYEQVANQTPDNATNETQDPSTSNGFPNTNESYERAWTGVHETFTDRCPDAATFVWTINGANRGPDTSFLGAFPGEGQVDMTGIRGINLGTHQPQGWASFGATVGAAYCNLTQQTDLDVVITGLGSVEDGGDKPTWIEESFQNASSHAWHRIAGVTWFNDELMLDTGESVDVSVNSSQASLQAYRSAVERLDSEEIPDGEAPPC